MRLGGFVNDEDEALGFDGFDKGGDHVLVLVSQVFWRETEGAGVEWSGVWWVRRGDMRGGWCSRSVVS